MPKGNGKKQSQATFIPSNKIKQTITNWEGDPNIERWVKPNAPFEKVAQAFYNVIPSNMRQWVMDDQDLADYLYSYAYNVGPGKFQERVIPTLQKYYNGRASIEDVTSSMWSYGERKPKMRGLRTRRGIEKKGVADALQKYDFTKKALPTQDLNFDNSIVPDAVQVRRNIVQPIPRIKSDYTNRTPIAPPPMLDINQSSNSIYQRMRNRAENKVRMDNLFQQLNADMYDQPQYPIQPVFGETVQTPYDIQTGYARGKIAFPFWNRFGNTMSLFRQ